MHSIGHSSRSTMCYHLPQSSLSAFSDVGCPPRWGTAGWAAAFGEGSPHLSLSQPESVASAAQQAGRRSCLRPSLQVVDDRICHF